MRIGDLARVTAGDVVFWVKWNFGQMKQLGRKFNALDATDLDAFDALMAGDVLPYVKKVEGLVSEDGEPIETLTPEVLDTLPPQIVLKLIEGLQGVKLEDPPA